VRANSPLSLLMGCIFLILFDLPNKNKKST